MQVAKTRFVEKVRRKEMGVTNTEIDRFRRQSPSEPGEQSFVQFATAERLKRARVKA